MMEVERGCQELQTKLICDLNNATGQGSVSDYIIDRFMTSLRVRESPHQYQNNEFPPTRFHSTRLPPRRRLAKGADVTEEVLKKVCVKLEMVARDRYVMQQKARIEQCRSGMDLKNLEQIQWYHYSKCPKKYTQY